MAECPITHSMLLLVVMSQYTKNSGVIKARKCWVCKFCAWNFHVNTPYTD